MTYGKFFVGVFVAFVLMGIYSWFDHNRVLECRTAAVANGTDADSAVNLCKR